MPRTQQWLAELEGLRGLAALWVFTLHVSILTDAAIPFIKWGALGVDLFILLSGFLMAHHFEQRQATEPWTEARTIRRFYVRRFFRIAPLYYVALSISLIVSGALGNARTTIGAAFPATLTEAARYSDHTVGNVLAHVSFVFGLLPQFSFETPLPDWSIGLEMQFYAVFPLLMLLVLRIGYKGMGAVICLASVAGALLLPHWYAAFEMPSFLPLKIYLFVAGMLIAAAMHGSARWALPCALVLPALALIGPQGTKVPHLAAELLMVLLLYGVTAGVSRPAWAFMRPVRFILNSRICGALGDFSYSLYLVHLVVALPVIAYLVRYPQFVHAPRSLRFLIALFASSAVVMPISWVLYRLIETRGIKVGKRLLTSSDGAAHQNRESSPRKDARDAGVRLAHGEERDALARHRVRR